MESWQKEHIKKNLVKLLNLTDCNTRFIAHLKSKNVLGTDDQEYLENKLISPSDKAQHLYKTLQRCSNSYDVLIQALELTRQTGAVELLKFGYTANGLVYVTSENFQGTSMEPSISTSSSIIFQNWKFAAIGGFSIFGLLYILRKRLPVTVVLFMYKFLLKNYPLGYACSYDDNVILKWVEKTNLAVWHRQHVCVFPDWREYRPRR